MGEKEKSSADLIRHENLKIGTQETMKDYYTRFNVVYNSIPQNLRPPHDFSLIQFPDGFDSNMDFQRRERDLRTLEEMQGIVVFV